MYHIPESFMDGVLWALGFSFIVLFLFLIAALVMGWVSKKTPLPKGKEAQLFDPDGDLKELNTGDVLAINESRYIVIREDHP